MSKHQPDDLATAAEFLAEISAEFDLDPAIIETATPYLLGLTKHVAHGVVRPAAPLAAFLVGLASAGDSSQEVLDKIARVEALLKERNLEVEETAE